MRRVIPIGLLGALGAALTPVPAAAATAVACGSVITADTTLTADLDCPGNGLVIGADGVTLDLSGYQIVGRGAPGSTGIENPGFDDVSITNGFVHGFDWAVELRANAERNMVARIGASGLRYGLVVFNSSGNVIDGNDLEGADPGPRGGFGAGLAMFRSHGNRIVRNGSVVSSANGIVLVDSNRNTIQGNEAAWVGADGNQGTGITLLDSDDNAVVANEVAENGGDGIFVDTRSAGTYLAGNLAANNRDLGIDARAPVTDGGGNRAFGNRGPAQCRHVRCAGSEAG